MLALGDIYQQMTTDLKFTSSINDKLEIVSREK